MSRFGGPRSSDNDLAYGELPQRWDRDRFERSRGGPPQRSYEDDYRYYERDTPRRQDISIAERIDERGPRGSYQERDRYEEHDRFTPGGRRKRTDKELFGDVDPREIANLALTPYRRPDVTREEIDITERRSMAPPRPGLLRRQSSLDTFDRRPIPRYERERIPIYTPVPVPIYQEERGRDYYQPEDYREVEITREKSVHRTGGPPPPRSVARSVRSSRTKSRAASSSSSSTERMDERMSIHESNHGGSRSVHEHFHESIHGGGAPSIQESFHESIHDGTATSISESIQQTEKKFKKGKTRMPKRLVRREAIMDLGYPFDEEEDFYVLRIALEKEQIDEVIRITETYKNGEKKTVYQFQSTEAPIVPAGEREEVFRTEWINPPTVVGNNSSHHHRSMSRSDHHSRHSSPDSGTTRGPSKSHRSRSARPSMANNEFFEERRTIIEESSRPPPPPFAPVPYSPPPRAPEFYEERKTVIEESGTFPPLHQTRSPTHAGTLVVQEREFRSDRDIQGEIARLEAERRALRLEREAEERRDLAVRIRERPDEDFQLVEYRDRDRSRPAREVLELYRETSPRDKSPPKNVLRVEKDRKEKKKARIVAAAIGTLT